MGPEIVVEAAGIRAEAHPKSGDFGYETCPPGKIPKTPTAHRQGIVPNMVKAATRAEDASLPDLQAEAEELRRKINRFRTSLGRFFVQKQEIIDLMVVAAIAQEPLLLVGPPGTAKSHLVLKFKDALGVSEEDYFD